MKIQNTVIYEYKNRKVIITFLFYNKEPVLNLLKVLFNLVLLYEVNSI